MNPWEVLGVEPGVPRAEIAEAYRVLAQIFHPDRFVEAPERIQEEARRRMQEVNEAYRQVCDGKALPRNRKQWASPSPPYPTARPPRHNGSPSTRAVEGMSWEAAARYRATLAARHREAREAEEASLPKGVAVARPRPLSFRPSTLLGLGLARETGKLRCRGCNSIQWLPPGWRERLESADFYCSLCGRRILAR